MYLLRGKTVGCYQLSCLIILITLITSCVTVKQFPKEKPFVYNHSIKLSGYKNKDEKKKLLVELENYWDDSLQIKKKVEINPFTIYQTPYAIVIKSPPVFDSLKVEKTKVFMTAFLKSKGYYYSSITDTVFIDTPKRYAKRFQGQYRATINLLINLGKNITVDTLSYNFIDTLNKTVKDTTLQMLAMQQYKTSALQKGSEYTKQKISDELDRLVNWFRQNGYFKFTREHIYALVDTTNEDLFKLTLDPIELANKIAEAEKKRKENPAWKVSIKQRTNADSQRLNKYFINHVYYYPETKITDIPDSLMLQTWPKEKINRQGDLSLRDFKGKYKLRPLREHTFLRKDSVYRESDYFKTINRLSRIGSWQQVDARINITGEDSLDLHFFLVPQKKYQTDYNLESSRNTGDFTAGNLLGISFNATLNNRNIWKQAILSSTSLRAGIELNLLKKPDATVSNSTLIQTLQFSGTHSYSIPRLLMPKTMANWKIFKNAESRRTIITASLAYTERFDIFRLRSANISMGYEGQNKKGDIFLWKPINLELYSIDTLPGLDTLFKANPFLRNSFNTGNVVGFLTINYSRTRIGNNKDNTHFLRAGFEESGLFTSIIPSLENKVYRFIKFETEYKFSHKEPKSELAYRFFGGIGIPFAGQSLPFFKQYFAGGPNSMRAWGLRQLGLGSSVLSDTIPTNAFRDRFGDVQLEANLEYRFNLATIGSFKIASAVFMDIGNIWNLKKDATNANAEFSLKRFYKDIAIGAGTGLRFDFSYFLIRFDFAYKVKDPGRKNNDGWMSIKDFVWTEYRNNINKTEIRNYAFQLGIGLPF